MKFLISASTLTLGLLSGCASRVPLEERTLLYGRKLLIPDVTCGDPPRTWTHLAFGEGLGVDPETGSVFFGLGREIWSANPGAAAARRIPIASEADEWMGKIQEFRPGRKGELVIWSRGKNGDRDHLWTVQTETGRVLHLLEAGIGTSRMVDVDLKSEDALLWEFGAKRVLAVDLDSAGTSLRLDLDPLGRRGTIYSFAYSSVLGRLAFCLRRGFRCELFSARSDGSDERLEFDLTDWSRWGGRLILAAQDLILVDKGTYFSWLLPGDCPETLAVDTSRSIAFVMRRHTVAAVAGDEVIFCRWEWNCISPGYWYSWENIRVPISELVPRFR